MKKNLGPITAALMLAISLTGCGAHPAEEGVELLEEGKYEEAIGKFEEAIEKGKNEADAYRGIGIARWELEDYEGALSAFQSALEQDAETTATLYNFLGNCEMKLGDAKSALNYYRLGIASEDCSDEMKQEMRFNEIAAYEQTGDYESARTKLKKYLKDYPDDERAAKEAEFLETR